MPARNGRPEQRAKLLEMIEALDASKNQLMRDEACPDWIVRGKRGQLWPTGDGFTLVLFVDTKKQVTFARKALEDYANCEFHSSGEAWFLTRSLPTPDQAAVIRRLAKIRRRKVLSEDALAKATARLLENRA